MGKSLVAIVTGANRGIGEAIVRKLAKESRDRFILYATSRKGIDLGLETAPEMQVVYQRLDIADTSSIKNFVNLIQKEHRSVDVLVNNAGVNLDDNYSLENVKITLDTNVRGTLQMCRAFIPLLSKNGRIVNVSSTGSSLNQYSTEIQQRFRSAKMTLQDVESMMQEYQGCVNDGTEIENGWPQQSYSVSKACINALTAVLARENQGLIINACCPGWVSTDMGKMVGSRPPKPPSDGAKIPIRLGFEDIGDPPATGRYWGNPSIADEGEGQVMNW